MMGSITSLRNTDRTCRNILMLLGFFGFAILYMLRVNLSVAIIAMSKHSRSKDIVNRKLIEEGAVCPEPQHQTENYDPDQMQGEFDWNEQVQGTILGYFFKGYVLTNLLGGRLADSYGGRKIYGLGVLLTGVLALVLPAAARSSTEIFCFVRLLQGMTEGVTFPALTAMMSSWVPPQERTVFLGRVTVGSQFGTVLTMAMSGWLAQSSMGWPIIFYLSSFIAFGWTYFWFRCTANTPDCHRSISEAEKLYIQVSIGDDKINEKLTVPWSKILTSVPYYALIITHIGNNWGFYIILTELPSYLSSVHHLNMKNSGLLSALPYLVMLIFIALFSKYIEHLIITKQVTTRSARRLATFIGFFIPSFLLLFISSAGCNTWLAIAIICCCCGISGANSSGFLCGYLELAPNFAGTITGLGNSLASIPGFLAPQFTGFIVNDKPTIGQWDLVFQVTALIYFVAGVTYITFMSAEVQPWNYVDGERTKKLLKPIAEIKDI